ncbi:MAG: nitroreductase [bacterium]
MLNIERTELSFYVAFLIKISYISLLGGFVLDIIEAIKGRRSIRAFKDDDVAEELLLKIIEAGSYAPSGHNNQPWSFVIIRDKAVKDEISLLTAYKKIINNANSLIVVFLDKDRSYDRDKDLMAVGACIQNMLLYAYSIGLGTVWLGEILKNKEKLRQLLEIPPEKEVMAVIALGYPLREPAFPGRMSVDQLVLEKK